MGLLYGRAGRLTAENGGFRPGQSACNHRPQQLKYDARHRRKTVRARPGRLGALSVFHSKSSLYGGFVWACRALNGQKRRFPARAGASLGTTRGRRQFFRRPLAPVGDTRPAAARRCQLWEATAEVGSEVSWWRSREQGQQSICAVANLGRTEARWPAGGAEGWAKAKHHT